MTITMTINITIRTESVPIAVGKSSRAKESESKKSINNYTNLKTNTENPQGRDKITDDQSRPT